MNDNKHIDRLFQEKLKDFEMTPNESAWEAIHKELHKENERKRRIIPIWWKLGGVAALLALLLTVGIKFMSNESQSDFNNSIIVDTEIKPADKLNNASESDAADANSIKNNLNDFDADSSKVAIESGSNSEDESIETSNDISTTKSTTNSSNQNQNTNSKSDKSRIASVDQQDSKGKNSSKTSNRSQDSFQKTNKNAITKDAVTDVSKRTDVESAENKSTQNKASQLNGISETERLLTESKNNNNSAVTDASQKMEDILSEIKKEDAKEDKSIEEAIAEATSDEEKVEKENQLNRWNVSPNVAPVYFNSLGKGSSLDEQFVNNKKDGEVTMSYGVGGSYALNNRLKVRAGINKVDFGYNTNNIIAFRSIDATSSARGKISNINENADAENITYLSSQSLNRSMTPEIINTKSQGAISQRFGFIEVPMEVEYALINKKLGVNVIGGFSTLIVDKNEVYSVIEGNEMQIGEANNINNMSYSANFGLGINYNISNKIKVNLEPTFKYQINTFNNSSGDFQPYFIGVYTGLSYKF